MGEFGTRSSLGCYLSPSLKPTSKNLIFFVEENGEGVTGEEEETRATEATK